MPLLLHFTSKIPCLVLNITSPALSNPLCWVQPNAESLNEAHSQAAGEHRSLSLSLFVPCWAELLAQDVTQCQPGSASLSCHRSWLSPQFGTVPFLSHDLADALSAAREGWERGCLLRARCAWIQSIIIQSKWLFPWNVFAILILYVSARCKNSGEGREGGRERGSEGEQASWFICWILLVVKPKCCLCVCSSELAPHTHTKSHISFKWLKFQSGLAEG